MAAPPLQPVHLGFNPTRQDVKIAEFILMGLRLLAAPGLPRELALSVLAHANYRPRTMSRRAEEIEYYANDFWEPGPQASVAGLYLTTEPLPPYFRRASSITLQMRSADQGWATFGGDGTYENSHTWFEACILRPLPSATASAAPPVAGGDQQPLEMQMAQPFRSPGDAVQELEQQGWATVKHDGRETWLVHHNITASFDWTDYRVDWPADTATDIEGSEAVGNGEGFLSALKPGDKVALWARADQQAWTNRVAEAVIEIVYEVWV